MYTCDIHLLQILLVPKLKLTCFNNFNEEPLALDTSIIQTSLQYIANSLLSMCFIVLDKPEFIHVLLDKYDINFAALVVTRNVN